MSAFLMVYNLSSAHRTLLFGRSSICTIIPKHIYSMSNTSENSFLSKMNSLFNAVVLTIKNHFHSFLRLYARSKA